MIESEFPGNARHREPDCPTSSLEFLLAFRSILQHLKHEAFERLPVAQPIDRRLVLPCPIESVPESRDCVQRQKTSRSCTLGPSRHKSHVAGTIAKAQERREEKLGDSTFDAIMQLQRKALELLGKMESEGDYRGAIGASREARECLVSANELTAKAADGSGGIVVTVQ